MTYNTALFSFIETKLFSRLLREYLTDDEYALLQGELMKSPERGALIPGSGGVRKLRWAQSGRGKRGGIRLIYYAKNEAKSIPAHVLRKIKEEIDG
jgi:mRNA-degrading endonuclease RelE of RelBE toxin-antitoxin system